MLRSVTGHTRCAALSRRAAVRCSALYALVMQRCPEIMRCDRATLFTIAPGDDSSPEARPDFDSRHACTRHLINTHHRARDRTRTTPRVCRVGSPRSAQLHSHLHSCALTFTAALSPSQLHSHLHSCALTFTAALSPSQLHSHLHTAALSPSQLHSHLHSCTLTFTASLSPARPQLHHQSEGQSALDRRRYGREQRDAKRARRLCGLTI